MEFEIINSIRVNLWLDLIKGIRNQIPTYLSYQPHLNPIIRSYAAYGFTIGTTYHYSGHNSIYSTLNCLDWLLTNKHTKNKWPWFPSGLYRPRLFNNIRFILTYGQTLCRIFHISFFFIHLYSFPCTYMHSPTNSWHLQYFLISNNGTFSHLYVYIFLTISFRYKLNFIHFYQVHSFETS